jgi:Protein of unknown function (DUF2934)
MSTASGTPERDDIARVAYAIWESEGCPEGRDHEHWTRARQLIEEGRADAEYPQAAAGGHGSSPRPVQPGFEDAAPGMVPRMKEDPGPELKEGPGGRFAKQLADLPEEGPADAPEPPAASTPASPRNASTARQSRTKPDPAVM